jgi:uncharacterized membrane protein
MVKVTTKQLYQLAILVALFCLFAAPITFKIVGKPLGSLVKACGLTTNGCPKPCLLLVHAILFSVVVLLAFWGLNSVETYVRVQKAKERYAKARVAKERYVRSQKGRESYRAPSSCTSCSR